MKLAIYGYGGHAREVAAAMKGEHDVTFFVDDKYCCENTMPLSKFDNEKYMMMIAIGDSFLRKAVAEKLPADTIYFTYIHPTALLLDDNIDIGIGSYIGPNCVLTTNIILGEHCLLNRGVHIGHDCRIGNYFSAMPSSVVGGNVNICDCVYLGSQASIKEKIEITKSSTIGMAAAVVKNISKEGTYTGVPAKLKI
jgi:sugar O-acyltransferase (sialic acid O-acetyltransferase NeuD family)